MTDSIEKPDLETIFDEEEEDDQPIIEGEFDPIVFSPSQRRIQDLNTDYANGDLDPRPSFQRGYVWDRTKASRLVESVLLNVPLPLIYTAEDEDEGKEVVIDGQQRVLTLISFIKGVFPRDGRKFKLGKLNVLTELNGKTYEELDKKVQRKFRQYTLSIIKIHANSQADVKFEIFERLNTGSVKLNAQELRNCVYRGQLNESLRELADYETFKLCLGTSRVQDRMQDAEMVLRFMAFYEKTYLNYNSGMKSFLNDYMDANRNMSNDRVERLGSKFKHSAEVSFSIFGRHAFRRYNYGGGSSKNGGWEGSVNRALFDVVMWGFSQYEKRDLVAKADAIREAFIRTMNEDLTFRDAITAGTGDKGRTVYRFETWKNTLSGIVNDSSGEMRLFSSSVRLDLFNKSPICAICNQAIKEIDDAEVDHIVPFSKGGSTCLDNAQIAHRYCNRSKSNRY